VSKSAVRAYLLVIGLYTLLAIVLSYPLPLHLTTRVPGSATWALDEYSFVWNLWWFRYALLALGKTPLHTSYIFYPVGVDLGLYTLNILNGALAVPLLPLFPLVGVHNLQWLASTVLAAFGAYLLATYLLAGLRPHRRASISVAAFVAGLVYAFTSYRSSFAALGHYSVTSVEWSPFFLLYFLRTLRGRSWRNPIMAGLFLAFAVLASRTVAAISGLAAFFFLLLVWREEGEGEHRSRNLAVGVLIPRLVVMAAVAAIVGSPAIVQVGRAALQSDFVLSGWGDAVKLSADLAGFFTPSALHPFWGQDWVTYLRNVREGTARFSDVNMAYVGFVTPALALLGLIVHRRRARPWAVLALLFALLSLGPLLHVNGQTQFDFGGLKTTVPLPFILLHYVPLLKANRVPSRNMTMLMLMLAVLAAYGSHWLLTRARGWREVTPAGVLLIGVLSTLILLEHLAVPLPLTNAQVPDIYRRIASQEGDFAILSLPVGWRDSFGVFGSEDTRTQYYQSVHHKRLLSGNTSRNPPFAFDYFRRLPIISSLTALETYGRVTPEQEEVDRQSVAQFIGFFDVRYVVVTPAIPGRPPYGDTREKTARYLRDLFPLEKVYDVGGTVAYRVIQPALPVTWRFDLGTPQASMALGKGWDKDEIVAGVRAVWAADNEVRLFLPVRQAGKDYNLALCALPFAYPNAPTQTIELSVNGKPLGEPLSLSSQWNAYAVSVPGELLRSGLNDVALRFRYTARPSDVLPGQREVGSTGVRTPVDIEVTSGGPAAGNLAYITVNGRDASAHREGYNVALVDPQRGEVRDFRGFDTTANRYESDRLAQYLEAVPAGQIVILAVRGDAGRHLTGRARAALAHLGAERPPAAAGPQSYAVIGVQGAAPGTAAESAPASGTAYLRLGRNPDRRTLAAAFAWITWSTEPFSFDISENCPIMKQ
jgi:hypothetical protein